jgi:hypothetical protein
VLKSYSPEQKSMGLVRRLESSKGFRDIASTVSSTYVHSKVLMYSNKLLFQSLEELAFPTLEDDCCTNIMSIGGYCSL